MGVEVEEELTGGGRPGRQHLLDWKAREFETTVRSGAGWLYAGPWARLTSPRHASKRMGHAAVNHRLPFPECEKLKRIHTSEIIKLRQDS